MTKPDKSGFCFYNVAAFLAKKSLNFLLVSILSIRRIMVCLFSSSSCCMSLICSTAVLSSITTSLGILPSSTEYLDGFHYVSSTGDELWWAFYEESGSAYEPEAFVNMVSTMDLENVLMFFPTAEGFYDFENNEYIYQYKDHLGNVRLSFKREGNQPIVTDSNDYYPFGMSFVRNSEEDAHFGTGSYFNYKYNGKELQ